ncbi:MAG: NDP-sugar synthase [Candidatus Margulisiibacteriota bacterium]
MKAFIMAAGVGTRLEPLTLALPKPMVPLCNLPAMLYNIELLKKHGIKDITANLHYFPEQIQGYFKNGKEFGVELSYSYEEELLGTAGGVHKMARSTKKPFSTFVVLSSDVLMDIDLKKLIDFHKKKKALATIALVKVEDPSEFGVVILEKDSRIKAFQEKPKKEEALSLLANTGVYVFEKEVLDLIPEGSFYDFGRQLFPALVKENKPFYGFDSSSYWLDIGTIPNYIKANFDLAGGKVKARGMTHSRKIVLGRNSRISESTLLSGTIIIGDNCTIRDNCRLNDCIIWPDTVIGQGCSVDGSIIGSWCYLSENTVVGPGSIIANRCKTRPASRLKPGSLIPPDKTI